jgi:hypothetical protein
MIETGRERYDLKCGRRRKMFAVSMSDFEMDILRGCAKKEKISMSEMIRRALREYYLEKYYFGGEEEILEKGEKDGDEI